MPQAEPDEVDELIARRASADPEEVLRARVAALEADQRRLALDAAADERRSRRLTWGSLAGLWVLSAALPWIREEETGRTRSLLTSVADLDAVVSMILGVVLPAAFVAVLAWRLPRAGGVAMLALAAFLVFSAAGDAGAPTPLGPVLAAGALIVGGVARLLSD